MSIIQKGIVCLAVLFSMSLKAQLWKEYEDSAKHYKQKNNPDQSLYFYQLSNEELIKDSLYSKTRVAVLNNIANIYKSFSQFDKAESNYVAAIAVAEKLLPGMEYSHAVLCNNLGSLYREFGKYSLSESYMLRSSRSFETLYTRDNFYFAGSCLNLGNLYVNMFQFERAKEYYREAKVIFEKVQKTDNLYYAQVHIGLADVYHQLGDFPAALNLSDQAEKIVLTLFGKDHLMYGGSCLNKGILLTDMHRFDSAETYLVEAKRVFGLYETAIVDYLKTCNVLGVLLMAQVKYKESEEELREALQRMKIKLGEDHPICNDINYNLCRIYVLQHKTPEASLAFENAFAAWRKELKEIFSSTGETEKELYIRSRESLKNMYFSFTADADIPSSTNFAYAMLLENKLAVLNSSLHLRQSINSSGDTSLIAKYEMWISKRNQLAYWKSKPVAQKNKYANELEAASELLEKELTRLSADFRKYQEGDKLLKNLKVSLKTGEAAVEFIEFPYYQGLRWTDSAYCYALVLRKEKPEPELVKLFERRQLDSLLKYRSTSAGQHQINLIYSEKNIAGREASLYDIVWRPLENKLAGINTVYFSVEGALNKIAFSGLASGKGQFLSDKYKLVQLNTTASVVNTVDYTVLLTDRVSVFGAVLYDSDSATITAAAKKSHPNDIAKRSLPEDLLRDAVPEFRFLPGSEKELISIQGFVKSKNMRTEVFRGIQATEEAFKSLSGKNSPEILHIATHGFFFPDPKDTKKEDKLGGASVFRQSDNPLIRSGLALAGANNAWKGKPIPGVEDGILTAYEVSNMYLPNTKLAVLSACETGLGDIQGSEGVYGLQRAFKMAGVENLVMSLWKVPDTETAEFMQEFYKNLFARQTISDAYYHAQTIMKNKYRNEPYKWAAWVLIR